MDPSQIQGLPPGAIVKPLPQAPQQAIQGLPAGAIVKPIQQEAQQTSAPPASSPGLMDRLMHPPMSGFTPQSADQGVPLSSPDQSSGVLRGAEKGVTQTLGGASSMVGGKGASPAETQPQGIDEHIGNILENVSELMAAEGGAKALGVVERLEHLSGIGKVLKQYPILAKMLSRGAAEGVTQGAIAGGQAALKGDEHPLATGATAGVLGGTLGAVQGGLTGAIEKKAGQIATEQAKSVPSTVKVAGEELPKFGPEAKPTAEAVEQVKAAQQAGSQKAIKNIATESANKTLSKFGAKSAGAQSFGDAAKQIEAKAQPVFKKLDELSDNEYTGLRGQIDAARKVMKMPSSYEAYIQAESKVKDAESRIDALFDKHAAEIGPKDLENARAAWRDAKVLEKVHSAVEGAFSVPEEISNSGAAERTLSGNKLRTRLNTMLNRIPKADLERTVGKEGVQNLYEIAELNSTPAKAAKFDEVVSNVQQGLQKAGEAASKHYLGQGTVGTAKIATGMIVDRMTVDPKFSKMLVSAVKLGASPEIYVPALTTAFRSVMNTASSSQQSQGQ